MPLLLPVIDSRRIRETARIVSTQFASAQSEAMAKGRPVGVWIERLGANDTSTSLDRSAAMDIYLCEVPQPYSGDSIDSRVTVVADHIIHTQPHQIRRQVQRRNSLVRFASPRRYHSLQLSAAPGMCSPAILLNIRTRQPTRLTAPDANGIKYLDNSAIKPSTAFARSPIVPVSLSKLTAQAQTSYMDSPCRRPICRCRIKFFASR